MQKISPFLWFDNQAEEAVNFYISVFPDSKIISSTRYEPESAKAMGKEEGDVMTITFQLRDQEITVINGGPYFKLSEAFSFTVACENQEEVDKYWNALTADRGEESQCGWLKDKFGLSWQIVPVQMFEIMAKGGEASRRARQAMFQMKKFDIKKLEEAAAGK